MTALQLRDLRDGGDLDPRQGARVVTEVITPSVEPKPALPTTVKLADTVNFFLVHGYNVSTARPADGGIDGWIAVEMMNIAILKARMFGLI